MYMPTYSDVLLNRVVMIIHALPITTISRMLFQVQWQVVFHPSRSFHLGSVSLLIILPFTLQIGLLILTLRLAVI